jgi:general secretion pathway protein G
MEMDHVNPQAATAGCDHRGRRPRTGFTLVEMLVVLGIIVLLLAMVVPRFLGTQKQADIDTTRAQIKLLQAALDLYYINMKDFPTTEQGLQALAECPADLDEAVAARWKGPYMKGGEMPKDAWGRDFQYEYPPTQSAGENPDIWSWGPDGEDGTEDDVCSWNKEAAGEGTAGATTEKRASPSARTAPKPARSYEKPTTRRTSP